MTAAGLPSHELCPYGREPTSKAFFKAPEIERLYSGVTKRTASLSLMMFRNVVYSAGSIGFRIYIFVIQLYIGRLPISTNCASYPLGNSSTCVFSNFC